MIMQRLSSERLLDGKLLGNLTRRRAAHILIAFLVNFFTVSVPLMMSLPHDMRADLSSDVILERQLNTVESTMALNLVFCFILGIYFGVVTMSYMMRRRSAYFWHALPAKRETLYVTSMASSFICAGVGACLSLAVTLIVLISNGAAQLEVFACFFKLVLKNLIYFAAAYAITVFAGSFTGSGVVQVLMSLVVMFYPAALLSGLLMLHDVGTVYFNVDYYFNLSLMTYSSPVVYAGFHYLDGFSVVPTVAAVLSVVLLLFGGLLIYRRRAIESAEQPIVFKKLGSVIKYLLVLVVTIYAGLFFDALGGSSWMIFGFICGGLLCFMLVNTILSKSPKAMFRGLRGLCVYAVAFALFFTVWGIDVFHMDERVPKAENLSGVRVQVNRYSLNVEEHRFDDAEMLGALTTLLENQVAADGENLRNPYSTTEGGSFRLEVVLYTKLGIPIARDYTVEKTTAGARDFLKLYADSGVVDECFAPNDARAEESGWLMAAEVTEGDTSARMTLDYAEFWKLYRREIGVLNYERLRQVPVGKLEFWNLYCADQGGQSYLDYEVRRELACELPIYGDMTETLAYLRGQEGRTVTEENRILTDAVILMTDPLVGYSGEVDETIVYDADSYSGYATVYEETIYDIDTGDDIPFDDLYPTVTLDAEETAALMPQLVCVQTPFSSVFVDIDTTYFAVVRYTYPLSEEDAKKYYGADVPAETVTRSSEWFLFAAGGVPESVKNKFN